MNVVIWVVTVVLAVAFIAVGGMKLARSKAALQQDPRMGWTEDFSELQIKGIGALELIGGVGLVLPPIVGTAVWLVPVAAAGLFLVMCGAVVTHARRTESQAIPVPAVLGVLALLVAILRFGPFPL